MYEDIREEAEANRGKSRESRVKINLDTALDELGGATEKVSFNILSSFLDNTNMFFKLIERSFRKEKEVCLIRNKIQQIKLRTNFLMLKIFQ